jgi:uncharacterized membrane protein YjjP (DUF1212 family)
LSEQEEIVFTIKESSDIEITLCLRSSSTDLKKLSRLNEVVLTCLNQITNLQIVTIEAEQKVKSTLQGRLITNTTTFHSDGLTTKAPF